MGKVKSFLRFCDLESNQLQGIIDRGLELKANWYAGQATKTLAGKTLAMLFTMPSTRTRVSFEAGMGQLGGTSLYISSDTTQMVRQEPLADTARVIGSMTDAVVIRTYEHSMVTEFAQHCRVPVINGLTKLEHPCQVLADLMTFQEVRGPLAGQKVSWVGDCNNVCFSWMQAAAMLGFEFAVATPLEYANLPDGYASLAGVTVGADPIAAVDGAACVVTDVWASMGDDEALRKVAFGAGYGVDAALLARAAPDAIFMHCLPAHRGEEVSAEVIDGTQSVVWTEAENRMHVQKALLEFLLGSTKARER